MRPQTIVTFERCYIIAWVIGVINLIITWSTQPAVASLPGVIEPQGATALLIIWAVVDTILTFVLLYLVARRASVLAKWIVTVLFVIGLIGLLWSAYSGPFVTGIGVVLLIVTWIFYAVAVCALYAPSANRWLGVGGRA